VVAAALVAVALGLPPAGVVVPGHSFAGLHLGATQTEVRDAWGLRFGRCRGCPQPTWYFTYKDFQPQGAGVALLNGRVTAMFTIWSPPGWRTSRGLKVGEPEARVGALYGPLPRTECGTYAALVLRRGRVDTQFYVYKGVVWGFGLSRAGAPPCH
jgi:hypothetical protein